MPLELPLPLVFAQDPREFAGILAAAFYDHPSQRMITVGVTGTNGKTTTSWIMRSIFEESEHITGMLGTVEWALANERLDTMGEIWEPMEEDTTLKRDSSAPFWGAPYKGKYSVPCTTPDAIHVRPPLLKLYFLARQALDDEILFGSIKNIIDKGGRLVRHPAGVGIALMMGDI